MRFAAGVLALSVTALAQAPASQAPAQAPSSQAPSSQAPAQAPSAQAPSARSAAQVAADRALEYLVTTQHPDGSWGSRSPDSMFDSQFAGETYYCWQVGAHCLATMALRRAPQTPARRVVLDKAVRWVVKAQMPLRGNHWDNDAVWAWLYGTVALTELAADPRFQGDDWRMPVAARGKEFVAWLAMNQVPNGGFGYYDDAPFTKIPKWGTSFATSAVVPALGLALALGWLADEQTLLRAASYVKRCRLPNGAYEYDLNPIPRLRGGESINNVKGSLGRIQVSNWALHLAKDPDTTIDRIRIGVQQFFEHHEFLQVARMRPIPHEAYYQNAGYFYFFGHFYCSQAIQLLPQVEREEFHAQLRPYIVAAQRPDGSFCDFQNTSYMTTSSTAFSAMALLSGLEPAAK